MSIGPVFEHSLLSINIESHDSTTICTNTHKHAYRGKY
jgi:hypothetical protein